MAALRKKIIILIYLALLTLVLAMPGFQVNAIKAEGPYPNPPVLAVAGGVLPGNLGTGSGFGLDGFTWAG